jgi:gentisate 1,2-dioxygenase
MTTYIKAYEYESSVNPNLPEIPIMSKNSQEINYGFTPIDLSEIYHMDFPCTSPNLLASFIKVKKFAYLYLDQDDCDKKSMNASSHLFFIIQGVASLDMDFNHHHHVESGEILVHPCFQNIYIKNHSEEDLVIYYINDSPLVNYLGCEPKNPIFKSAIYSKHFIQENLEKLSNPNNNRKGILLTNKDVELLGVNTISPVLWALYNELPPKTIQKPHKHNSVALDFCIKSSDCENIYTLIGEELDENGNILNPQKIHWKEGSMFITPPGLWHSHNNIGDTYAYILPIQDAGLLLYQRILGIVLTN